MLRNEDAVFRFRVKVMNSRPYPVRTHPGWVEFPETRGKGGVFAANPRLKQIDADLGSELQHDPSSTVVKSYRDDGGKNTSSFNGCMQTQVSINLIKKKYLNNTRWVKILTFLLL